MLGDAQAMKKLSGVYYNENHSFNVEWLKLLIKKGMISDGDVDGRSIKDVRSEDFRGYRRAHFFSGIGVWDYALNCAGFQDIEGHVTITGSCPCQPFSVAGDGRAAQDERHLWPDFNRLITGVEEVERPLVILGEQVASDDGLAWLDLVCSDLERSSYTVGTLSTVACGFGAPHERQRLYWSALADAVLARCEEHQRSSEKGSVEEMRDISIGGIGVLPKNISDSGISRLSRLESEQRGVRGADESKFSIDRNEVARAWNQLETSPNSLPYSDGLTLRVARELLHGYGNAIVAQQATGFIEIVMQEIESRRAA